MRNKKWISVLLVFVMLYSLTACSSEAKEEKKAEDVQMSLYEHGLDIIELMVEVSRSEEYVELFGGPNEIQEELLEIGEGDYEEPKEVYAVEGTADSIMKLAELEDAVNLESLSVGLEKNLENRVAGAVVTQLNALEGTRAIVATSICTISETFVEEGLDENVIYIYIYKDAVPAAVTFIKGEDGSVLATGNFIMYEEFIEDSEALVDYLEDFGMDVEEVEFE